VKRADWVHGDLRGSRARRARRSQLVALEAALGASYEALLEDVEAYLDGFLPPGWIADLADLPDRGV